MSDDDTDAWVRLRIPACEPVLVRGSADDDAVIDSIRTTGHYEGDNMLALHQLLAPDAVCIDGGANIGALSLAMSLYAPDGHVFAFEPGRENLAHLEANIARNDASSITAVPLGLWSTSSRLQLHSERSHPAGAFIDDIGDAYSTAETIDVVALDDWVAEHGLERVDLIKLDIEGAEPHALAGARETIARFRPTLLVELNPLSLLRHGHDPDAFFADLQRSFPHVLHVTASGRLCRVLSRTHLHRLLQAKGLVDLVCTHELPASSRGHRRQTLAPMRELARLVWHHNRLRPPPSAFMCRPSYRARCGARDLRVRAGELTLVPTTFRNTSGTWWSSDFPNHPIKAAYHWADERGTVVLRDGRRTSFRRPVGPGRTVKLDLQVETPSAPGRYTLLVSLVQERFAWSDEAAPELRLALPVVVDA